MRLRSFLSLSKSSESGGEEDLHRLLHDVESLIIIIIIIIIITEVQPDEAIM
jgi:hypothetical protein